MQLALTCIIQSQTSRADIKVYTNVYGYYVIIVEPFDETEDFREYNTKFEEDALLLLELLKEHYR